MSKWLILVLILFAFFLPQIASTPLGKPFFVKALELRTHSKLEVASLSLSWFGPQKFQQIQWTHDQATGTVEEFQIHAPFWSFSGPFVLKNGTLVYKGRQVEKIEGEIKENDFQLTGITLQGHLSLKGKIYSQLHFNIQIDVKNFPSGAIDHRLDQILGSTLNLEGTIGLENQAGFIHLDLTSPNVNAKLRGFLTEHSITLRDPLIVTIRITPELSALLLKDANPLFLTGVDAKNPAILRIEPKDSLFPIPFSLEKLAARGTLDLGQVQCQNGKSLAALISLLKADRLSNAKQMNAWFTPIDFQIKNGTIETGRMDALLADSIHVCTWGDIDLLKDQIRMFFGIPADTLQQSFGIKNLPDSYVLKVQVRGSTQDPEIVKAPAAAKIAALIAAGQIPKKGILGGIAELFSKPKEDKEIPPAKRPFPWEHLSIRIS